MTTQYPIPVRYVLYSHYPEGKDFDSYASGKKPFELDGVQSLVRHLAGLRGLLTWSGYEGLLVLFYAPGFAECLEGIAAGEDKTTLTQRYKELEFASAVQTYLKQLLEKDYEELAPRLRFVTPLDLQEIFGRMKNWKIIDRLRTWLAGPGEGTKYDSPKTVEAIVRLRLLGSGIPVFRIDHDVMFRRKENWNKKNLEFSSTIGSCLKAYELRRDSSKLSSFIFSASYDHQALRNPRAKNRFSTWNRAFAIRVFPALPIRVDLITKVRSKKGNNANYDWQKYAINSFSPSLARKFFGLDEDRKVSTKEGIAKVGAHPVASVISGAMLYLSDGAILDLPPFSNFRLNVSWIDDHLKYCLHRELRHLSRSEASVYATETTLDPLLAYARLDDVIVQKAGRSVREDFPKYLFDEYLPTLLWGTIMDAWITPAQLLKYRPKDLSDENRKSFSEISRTKESGAALPSALQKALRQNGLGSAEKDALEKNLLNIALQRINEVRNQWMELTEDGVKTFASIWAKGEVKSFFPGLKLKYSGICVASVRADKNVNHVDQLNRHLHEDLERLVKDAIEYIEWTINWPTIVQVVRSIEQGTLRTDLNFDPENERTES